MALIEFNRDPPPRQVRQFAMFWLSGFCFVLAGLALYRYASTPSAIALAAGGLTSILVGIIRPAWMRLVFLGWMWAAFPIGWLISHALIAVLYYGVVTPIGVVMRMIGRDPLSRQFDRDATTYWSARSEPTEPSRYFRQF